METFSKDELMDTDSNKMEQEQMEVGSQPAMDHMEVEEGMVYNSVEVVRGEPELVMEAMQVEVDEAEDRGDGHHHVDGAVADGDRGDVRGVGDILDVQTKVQPSRPQALWKAKRRRRGE